MVNGIGEQISKYTSSIFEPNDIIEVRLIPSGRSTWRKAVALSSSVETMMQQNERGEHIYVGANPRKAEGGTTAKDVALARCLFGDFDNTAIEEARHRWAKLGMPEPTLIINSGHGIHAYWRLAEPVDDLAAWSRFQQDLSTAVGSDPAIHDAPRLMRLPGFINHKPPSATCSILDADAGRIYDLDLLSRHIPEHDDPSDHTGPCASNNGKIPKGHRNSTLMSIAGTLRSRGAPVESIDAALRSENQRRCEPPLPDDEVGRIAENAGKYPPFGGFGGIPNRDSSDSWPDPQPLPDGLPPVREFDASLLPSPFNPWICDIAERMQCPIDFLAVAAMTGIASLVGRQVGIRPKRCDDWLVLANLWALVVGRPGVLKTPAIQESLRPLKRMEIDAKEAHDEAKRQYQTTQMVAEQRRKVGADKIKKALKDGADAERIAREMLDDEIAAPIRHRFLANDSSVEKLGELLNENPNGLLVFRDEVIGLLKSLDKLGQECARAFYLEAWDGNGRFTYDRIGRGTIDIEAATISIVGAIQPGPLSTYLRGAVKFGTGDDGLIQRFQLAVYPDISPQWQNVDEYPDTDAKNKAYEIFTRLGALDLSAIEAQNDELDSDGIPFTRFDADAQALFDSWRAKLEARLRSGDEHPAFESHLAKFRSLIPSLALLIHLAEGGKGRVATAALAMAIRWGDYLESHARRIYAAAIESDVIAAKSLAKKIRAGDVNRSFALRDVYHKGWTGLGSSDEVQSAVDVLVDLDWLRAIKESTAGAPRMRYHINPKISEMPKEGASKTSKREQPQQTTANRPTIEDGREVIDL